MNADEPASEEVDSPVGTRRDRATARAREISESLTEKARTKAVDVRESHASVSFTTDVWDRFVAVEGNEAVLILTLLFCAAVLPAAIVMFAWSAYLTGSETTFGQSMAEVWHLAPGPAEQLSAAFTTDKSSLASAASVGILTFAMVGVGYASTLEKVYRGAWGLPTISGRVTAYLARLAVFTFMFLEIGAMHVLGTAIRNMAQPFRSILLATIAAPIVVATWLVVARVFLRGHWPGIRAVLPGIVFGVVSLAALDFIGAAALGKWIVTYTTFYGIGGIMIALLFWYWIIAYVWVLMPVISAVIHERRSAGGTPEPEVGQKSPG